MAKVIILSGAGISAKSGISTFRDEDGLWENHDIADICSSGCLKCNKLLRPNIVFFGENAPKYQDMYKEFGDCEVFVVIGTSGAVIHTYMF